jgi:hypothetical protein
MPRHNTATDKELLEDLPPELWRYSEVGEFGHDMPVFGSFYQLP